MKSVRGWRRRGLREDPAGLNFPTPTNTQPRHHKKPRYRPNPPHARLHPCNPTRGGAAPKRVARRPGRAKLPDPDEHPTPAPQETPLPPQPTTHPPPAHELLSTCTSP